MAITNRLKVSFDIKMITSTGEFQGFTDRLVEMTRKFTEGEKLNGAEKAIIKEAAENGPEAAFILMVKMGISKWVKDEVPEAGLTVSNVAVRA